MSSTGAIVETQGQFVEFTDPNGTPLVSLNRDGTITTTGLITIAFNINGGIAYLPIYTPPGATYTILDGPKGFIGIQADSGHGINVGGQLSLQSVAGPFAVNSVLLTDNNNNLIQIGPIEQSPTTQGVGIQCQAGGQIQLTDNSSNGFAYDRNSQSFIAIGNGSTVKAPTLVESQTLSPTSSSTAGVTGQIAWDTNFIYICTNGGAAGSATWKKATLASA
jgi:hypothetical protein